MKAQGSGDKKSDLSVYVGKYAMRDLVQKLPSGNPQRDVGTSGNGYCKFNKCSDRSIEALLFALLW